MTDNIDDSLNIGNPRKMALQTNIWVVDMLLDGLAELLRSYI